MLEVVAPAASLTVSVPTPATAVVGRIVIRLPADEAVLPAPTVLFALVVAMGTEQAQVQVDVDTDPGFTAPTSLTAPTVMVNATAATLLRVGTPLGDGIYFWRVRLSDGVTWQPWSTVFAFTVNTATVTTTGHGSLTVDAALSAPSVLWFTHPDVAVPGDQITLFGVGLVGGTVDLCGLAATVLSATTVAATADAYTADRTINALTAQVDVAHDQLLIVVPDATPPGGPLTVNRS